jgi:hypothetical protein
MCVRPPDNGAELSTACDPDVISTGPAAGTFTGRPADSIGSHYEL